MAIGHKLDTKIVSEEIYILVWVKLWAQAVDVDNRRTNHNGRIVLIAVKIVGQSHAQSDGDPLIIGW